MRNGSRHASPSFRRLPVSTSLYLNLLSNSLVSLLVLFILRTSLSFLEQSYTMSVCGDVCLPVVPLVVSPSPFPSFSSLSVCLCM